MISVGYLDLTEHRAGSPENLARFSGAQIGKIVTSGVYEIGIHRTSAETIGLPEISERPWQRTAPLSRPGCLGKFVEIGKNHAPLKEP